MIHATRLPCGSLAELELQWAYRPVQPRMTATALRVADYINANPGADSAKICRDLAITTGALNTALTTCDNCGVLMYEEPCPDRLWRIRLYPMEVRNCK